MVIFYHLSIRSQSAFSLSWTFRWDLQDNTSGSLTRINFPPLPGRYNYLLSPPWLWVLISCSVPLISILKLSLDNWEIRFSCTEVWHHEGSSQLFLVKHSASFCTQYRVFYGVVMCLIYLGSCLYGCGCKSNHCYCLTIWWYDIVCSYRHKLQLSINWSADGNITVGIIKCFLRVSRLEWEMGDKSPLNIIHH